MWKVDGRARARAPTANVRPPASSPSRVPMRARQTRSRIHWHPTLKWRVGRGDLSPTQQPEQPQPDQTQPKLASQPIDVGRRIPCIRRIGERLAYQAFWSWFIHIFSHCPNEMYETAERPITEFSNKLQIQRELRRVTLRQTIVKSRCQL